jgi:hypothetical protein
LRWNWSVNLRSAVSVVPPIAHAAGPKVCYSGESFFGVPAPVDSGLTKVFPPTLEVACQPNSQPDLSAPRAAPQRSARSRNRSRRTRHGDVRRAERPSKLLQPACREGHSVGFGEAPLLHPERTQGESNSARIVGSFERSHDGMTPRPCFRTSRSIRASYRPSNKRSALAQSKGLPWRLTVAGAARY